MINVLGPDVHVKNIGKIHFVQFAPEGVFGWILKDPLLIDSLVRGKLPVFIWPPGSNILLIIDPKLLNSSSHEYLLQLNKLTMHPDQT